MIRALALCGYTLMRLRLTVQPWEALGEVPDPALDGGMAAAKAEGWGLRQIGAQAVAL
ncbi:hypothetical protein [Streptomyces sp. SPB162]|uniref:hypothetical protein n=1 Tax=Streptomyces sp. SPB162 TaxID=2940560 RepID=UPI0024067A34|nr:hypothetical protein [Streptomyces sp. SPB162]MDF9813957.1 hypothetical protein [Streptomyces sp. SPB162]